MSTTFQGVLALSPESRRSAVVRHVDQQGLSVDDGVLEYGSEPSPDTSSTTRYPFALVASTSFDLGATLIEPIVNEAVVSGKQTACILFTPAEHLPASAYASLTAMLTSVVRHVEEAEEIYNDSRPAEPCVRAAMPRSSDGQPVDVFAPSSSSSSLSSFTELSAAPRQDWEHWLDTCWFDDTSSTSSNATGYHSSRTPSIILLNVGTAGGHVLISVVPVPSSEFFASVVAMQSSCSDGLPSVNAAFRSAGGGGGSSSSPASLLATSSTPFANFALDYLRHYFAHPLSGTAVCVGVPDLHGSCAPSAPHPLARRNTKLLFTAVSALHGTPTTARPPTPPHNPQPQPQHGSSREQSSERSSMAGGVGATAPLFSLKMLGGDRGPISPSPASAAAVSPTPTPAVSGSIAFHSPSPPAPQAASSFATHSSSQQRQQHQPASTNSSGVIIVDMDQAAEADPLASTAAPRGVTDDVPHQPRAATAQAQAALAALRAARQSGMREYDEQRPLTTTTTTAAASPSAVAADVSPSSVADSSSSASEEEIAVMRQHVTSSLSKPPVASRGSSSTTGTTNNSTAYPYQQQPPPAPSRATPPPTQAPLPVYGSSSASGTGLDDSRLSGFHTGAGSGSMASLYNDTDQQQRQQNQSANVSQILRGHEEHHHHHDPQQQQQHYLDAASVSRLQHISALETELKTVRTERDELSSILRKMSVRLTRAQDSAAAKGAEAAAGQSRAAALESELSEARDKLDEALSLLKKEQRDATVSGRMARKHAIERLEAKCGIEHGTFYSKQHVGKENDDGSVSPAPIAVVGGVKKTPTQQQQQQRSSSKSKQPQRKSPAAAEDATTTATGAMMATMHTELDGLRAELERERDENGVLKAALLSSMQRRENGDSAEDSLVMMMAGQRPSSDDSAVFDLVAQSLSRGIDIVSSRHSLTVARSSAGTSSLPFSSIPHQSGGDDDSEHEGTVAVATTAGNGKGCDRTADALKKLSVAVERLQNDKVPDVPRVVAAEADVLQAKFALTAEMTRLKHLDGLILPFGALLQQTIAAVDSSSTSLLLQQQQQQPTSPQAVNPVRDVPHAATPHQVSKTQPQQRSKRGVDSTTHTTTNNNNTSGSHQKKSKYIGSGALHPATAASRR